MNSDQSAAERYPFGWQRIKACPIYPELIVWGEYGYRRNTHADEDDRGGTVAWEVWHWPTNTVESDWFSAADAVRECRRLASRDCTCVMTEASMWACVVHGLEADEETLHEWTLRQREDRERRDG